VLPKASVVLQQALMRILKEINESSWHDKALALLQDKEPTTRRIGKELCSTIGGKTMFQLLAQGIRSAAFSPRTEVLETLVNIAGHHSLSVLKDIFPRTSKSEKLGVIALIGN